MSIKANSLINLPVIALNNGKNIAHIKDVVYDSATNKVTALVVDEKGWFSSAKIILIQDVESIGKDSIIVENESKIISANSEVDSSVALSSNGDNFLDTNQVITKSGTKLGKVTDIYFDENTGILEAIEVSEGFLSDIMSGTKKIQIDNIITVGEENLIVDDIAESKFNEQGQKQGLNKVADDAKITAINVGSQAGQKIQQATETIKTKTEQIVNSETMQNTLHKTQEVTENLKNKAIDTYTNTKESIQSGEAEKSLKDNFEKVKDKIANATQAAKTEMSSAAEHTKDEIEYTSDDISHKIMKDRISNATGKIIVSDVTIHGLNNKIIASRGNIITPEMIEIAAKNGVLERLLNSV